VTHIAADAELVLTGKSFAEGLLIEVLAALRLIEVGKLIGLTARDRAMGEDLERWARLTGNSIVDTSDAPEGVRFVIRKGGVRPEEPARPIGNRLWLYTNFDCNLACTYCCVRSSPRAPRRELGLSCVRRIADEAGALGVREIFLTGGEPFLLPDIGPVIEACAAHAPTTVLTNGMLFKGARLDALRALSRERVTLQISVDSPDRELHDENRGEGSWERAIAGIDVARSLGFRVRWAATVQEEKDERAFGRFLDEKGIVPEDRVIRRTALRGLARDGIALARVDLVPEATITDRGVFYHPVGADDDDFLVTKEIFPLSRAFDEVRRIYASEQVHNTKMAQIFNCA